MTAARAKRLKDVFDLTPEDYLAILAYQGGGCAICGRETADKREGWLPIDHDHKTGEVRGLLCTYHNRMLAPAIERVVVQFAEYLANPPARAALGRVVQGPIGPSAKRRRKRRPK